MRGARNSQIEQRNIYCSYKSLIEKKLLDFKDSGFRALSQTDEDGLIIYIFALIGFNNRKCIDIACGTPNYSNSANLILNWGFDALLIDGNKELVNKTNLYYKNHLDTLIYPPQAICKWITKDNINTLIKENSFDGEIDLLSLDIDGVDYWIWEAIEVTKPRVVVVEYMNIWDFNTSVTVPYKEDFNRFDYHEDYFGASLLSFKKLADKKGYILVGVNKLSYNAFFVKKDLLDNDTYEKSVEECLNNPYSKQANKTRLNAIVDFPWTTI